MQELTLEGGAGRRHGGGRRAQGGGRRVGGGAVGRGGLGRGLGQAVCTHRRAEGKGQGRVGGREGRAERGSEGGEQGWSARPESRSEPGSEPGSGSDWQSPGRGQGRQVRGVPRAPGGRYAGGRGLGGWGGGEWEEEGGDFGWLEEDLGAVRDAADDSWASDGTQGSQGITGFPGVCRIPRDPRSPHSVPGEPMPETGPCHEPGVGPLRMTERPLGEGHPQGGYGNRQAGVARAESGLGAGPGHRATEGTLGGGRGSEGEGGRWQAGFSGEWKVRGAAEGVLRVHPGESSRPRVQFKPPGSSQGTPWASRGRGGRQGRGQGQGIGALLSGAPSGPVRPQGRPVGRCGARLCV